MQVLMLVHAISIRPPNTYAALLHTSGDIKSFFGVKTEKQEPQIDSPATPTKQVKEENKAASNETSTPPVKVEEYNANEETPKKQFKQFPAEFVPASSLLTTRPDDDDQHPPPSNSPNKRRRVSSPANASKKPTPSKLKPPGPKQSSLDFFFGKAPK
ncbi:unnamed protein product [Phytophthora fragariaefolia]|uniref:Unnamed protein product n=1 Tax=Phytophthora fragariaefolia TaxID=1490495 RepID=A0A9W6UDP5_9STRA|nr:unnamed protein product [Phytophthora fragariaefolia]